MGTEGRGKEGDEGREKEEQKSRERRKGGEGKLCVCVAGARAASNALPRWRDPACLAGQWMAGGLDRGSGAR